MKKETIAHTLRSFVVAGVTSLGIIYFTNHTQDKNLHDYADSTRAKVLASQIAVCETLTNPLLAWEQHRARVFIPSDLKIVRRLLPIRNCRETYLHNGGKAVVLPNKLQEEYLRLIEQCIIPVQRGNKFVVFNYFSCAAK